MLLTHSLNGNIIYLYFPTKQSSDLFSQLKFHWLGINLTMEQASFQCLSLPKNLERNGDIPGGLGHVLVGISVQSLNNCKTKQC